MKKLLLSLAFAGVLCAQTSKTKIASKPERVQPKDAALDRTATSATVPIPLWKDIGVITVAPSSQVLFALRDQSSEHGMILEITRNGQVKLGEGITPDEATKQFIDYLKRAMPSLCAASITKDNQ